MPLNRPRWAIMTRLAKRERGATTILVAIVLVPVLFGAAALSIDIGSLMWERRQLQNGSDAAALRAAAICIESSAACPTAATPELTALASANAADNATTVTSICGNAAAQATTPALTLCASASATPPANPAIIDCAVVPSGLPSSDPYVELRTQTKTSSGAGSIVDRIASIVSGTNVSTTVKSCSRAAWGPSTTTSLLIFPIVMSYCDWARDTGYTDTHPASYPPGPVDSITPYGYGAANPWTSITEQVVYTKGNTNTPCQTWDGHTAPGNFYSIAASGCTVNSATNSWIQATTGSSTPCTTMAAPDGSSLLGKVIYIPIFDCLQGSPTTITSTTDCTGLTGSNAVGSNAYYHISGYAAFYLTGWNFTGSNGTQPSIKSGAVPCGSSDRCMSGWFLKDIIPTGSFPPPTTSTPTPTPTSTGTPPSYGTTSLWPAG